MPSVDELLNMAEVAEATLTETNDVIEIDADTRTMIIPDTERIFGVMSDEKGERKYFRCKRFVGNGIDLSKLDLRVIYQNASGLESGRDKYIVTDLATDGEDYVTFSWELSRKVTAYKGIISFIVCAIKTGTDGIITNEWNTTLANGIVLDGLEVSGTQEQEKEAYDYYKQLEAELEKKAQEVIGTIPSDYTQTLKDVSNLKGEVTDGRTDVDGNVHKNIGDAMRGQARKLRENLVIRQKEQPTDPNNNVWISDEDDEVEVPDMGEFNSLKEDIGYIITAKTSKQLFDDKIAKDNKIYQAVYHSSGISDYTEQEGWKIIGIHLNIAVNKAIKLRTNVNTNFKFMCFNADSKFSTAIEKSSDTTVSNSDGSYTVTIPYQNWDVINYICFEFLATGFTEYPIVTYESDYDPNITFFGKVVSLSDNFNVPYLDEEISKVNKKIVNIEEKINVSDNPCDYTGDEICIFGKGLLIGDSLTEGAFDCNESGSQDGFRHATMNYPSNLARITGIDFTNKGDAGKTIKAWYEAHKSDDLSGHDFCIIALGVNDVYFNKGWTSDAETYLTNIMNKVKTENNKIPIFIATIPMFFAGYEGADFEGMSQHIRTFAESNSLYLVDFRTYFTEFSADSYTKYGVTYYAHHNALGYYKIAHAYKSYISYIISKNIDDFKNVQFVGTNHSWTQHSSN